MPHVVEEDERAGAADLPPPFCCPHLHEAVELVGRRWTGAILEVLRQAPRPLRFSEIAQAVPDLSDRLCSERMKELEQRGLVERQVHPGPPGFGSPRGRPAGGGGGPFFGAVLPPEPPPAGGAPRPVPRGAPGGGGGLGFAPSPVGAGPGSFLFKARHSPEPLDEGGYFD